MIDFRDPALTARQVREALDLAPHPEGGFFREMFRDQALEGRGAATSIFFLLDAGQNSHWHRIDATEIWIFRPARRCGSASPIMTRPRRVRL